MARLPIPHVGIPARPSPGEALAALRRIMGTWELDQFDAAALVGSTTADITTIEWTDDRLLRVAYLIELETALLELNPKARIARWIATPNPGPYFGGSAPLELLKVGPHEMQALLHQIRQWTSRRS